MVKLIIGKKGTGKTKKMVDLANESLQTSKGNTVFLIKDDRLKHDLDHKIRMIVMDEYEYITNIDEYIGFIYGILSYDYDIETIFIDSLLKHADIRVADLTEFFKRLRTISEKRNVDFVISVSADIDELEASIKQYEIITH